MDVQRVYALGQDSYWLTAVAKIADERLAVEAIRCAAFPECLEHLPAADPAALLLVDATGQPDLSDTVRRLKERGWRHVAVVAADPSWRDARAVLMQAREYDYWAKSYVPQVIHRNVSDYLARSSEGNKEGLHSASG